jgi:hypothetical protein
MDSGSRWAVMKRALVYGVCMGALTGGPVFGAFFVLAAVIGGPQLIAAGLAVTVVGGALGALIGLIGAVLPGLVMASMSRYFREHPRIARACAAAISGLQVDAVFVLGHGGVRAATATGGGIAFLVFAFALFAAVGACSPNYVITGRKCAPARRTLQYLRRRCPCRQFRLDAPSAI